MGSKPADAVPIRDAATIIVLRDARTRPAILMGQRGSKAAFMPNKFVFPGGAVDPGDAGIPLAAPLPEPCLTRVQSDTDGPGPAALAAAAIRELWEESGLILGEPATWDAPPEDWIGFAETGYRPAANALRFVFRAITPPGRPRRFDARFFLVDAKALASDPDDFSRASDELKHLQWVPLQKARNFDLPFITEVVLAEVTARLPELDAPPSVPFFKNDDEETLFEQLGASVRTRLS